MRRDCKGLYAKAMRGEVPSFTGVTAPYEEPHNPEVALDTADESPEASIRRLLTHLELTGYITPANRAL